MMRHFRPVAFRLRALSHCLHYYASFSFSLLPYFCFPFLMIVCAPVPLIEPFCAMWSLTSMSLRNIWQNINVNCNCRIIYLNKKKKWNRKISTTMLTVAATLRRKHGICACVTSYTPEHAYAEFYISISMMLHKKVSEIRTQHCNCLGDSNS